MEIVDTQKLETAVIYLQRITEGRNPVTNMPAEEDSVINNPNVVRCMFFIKDILEELRRNDGYIGRRPRTNRNNNKLDVKVSDEEMAKRKAEWKPREPKVTTGYLSRYEKMNGELIVRGGESGFGVTLLIPLS